MAVCPYKSKSFIISVSNNEKGGRSDQAALPQQKWDACHRNLANDEYRNRRRGTWLHAIVCDRFVFRTSKFYQLSHLVIGNIRVRRAQETNWKTAINWRLVISHTG